MNGCALGWLVVLRRARLERHSTRLAESSRVPLAYSEGTRGVESSRVPSESVPSESYSTRRVECLPSGRAFRVILAELSAFRVILAELSAFRVILAEPSACALLNSLRTCYAKTIFLHNIVFIRFVLHILSCIVSSCTVFWCAMLSCIVLSSIETIFYYYRNYFLA